MGWGLAKIQRLPTHRIKIIKIGDDNNG